MSDTREANRNLTFPQIAERLTQHLGREVRPEDLSRFQDLQGSREEPIEVVPEAGVLGFTESQGNVVVVELQYPRKGEKTLISQQYTFGAMPPPELARKAFVNLVSLIEDPAEGNSFGEDYRGFYPID